MLRLAVFDLDGTLKQERDPYTYLHQRLGTLEAARAFTHKGVSGEIPYEEWLRLDVGLWRGVPLDTLKAHLQEIPYLPGARETVARLRARGVIVALISSGLLFHAEMVAEDLGIDLVFANEVGWEEVDGVRRVDGRVRARVPFDRKGPVLEQLQTKLGVPPAETLAVGDSASDIAMFKRARVGVAVNTSRPEVIQAAHIVLPEPDLRPLLPRLHRFAPDFWPDP
ncbi:MAG: hypothetical protein Kow0047_28450 [Anaerolineae bacterium]